MNVQQRKAIQALFFSGGRLKWGVLGSLQSAREIVEEEDLREADARSCARTSGLASEVCVQ